MSKEPERIFLHTQDKFRYASTEKVNGIEYVHIDVLNDVIASFKAYRETNTVLEFSLEDAQSLITELENKIVDLNNKPQAKDKDSEP